MISSAPDAASQCLPDSCLKCFVAKKRSHIEKVKIFYWKNKSSSSGSKIISFCIEETSDVVPSFTTVSNSKFN